MLNGDEVEVSIRSVKVRCCPFTGRVVSLRCIIHGSLSLKFRNSMILGFRAWCFLFYLGGRLQITISLKNKNEKLSNKRLKLKISKGLSYTGDIEKEVESLISEADSQLYDDKNRRRVELNF